MDKKITLEDAKKQVEYWKSYIMQQRNADNYYTSSGREREDERQLELWKEKVSYLEGK